MFASFQLKGLIEELLARHFLPVPPEVEVDELVEEADEDELPEEELEEVDGHCPSVYCLMPSL